MKIITSLLSSFKRNKEQPQHKEQTQESLTLVNHDDSVKTSIQYVEENNVIYHTNKHTTTENAWVNFYMDNLEYINPLKEKLLYFSMKANGKITDIDTTIFDCKETIKLFNILKEYCYKTPEGIAYFKYLWEPQNSYSHIETTKKRLQDLTQNYDKRKKYYEYIRKHLKNDLIAFLSEHENILQKNVYSYFDADFKDNIALLLYNMDKSGEITRIKHGNTYQLSLK